MPDDAAGESRADDTPVSGSDVSDSESTGSGTATDSTATETTENEGIDGGRPEVVVPMDLYKTVTVFSTLLSIALVVGGMIGLDAATARATADAADVNLPLAILGVASIVLGAATYAFAARFRAEGMGNAKDADDER